MMDAGRSFRFISDMAHAALTDAGAGMYVDPGKSVGVLAHNTWHKRDFLIVKLVSYPIDRHSEESGVAKDNLIIAYCSGVPCRGCPNIFCQAHSYVGQLPDKLH